MADQTLTHQTRFTSATLRHDTRPRPALVLLWSPDEPERVGEVLLPDEADGFRIYGRETGGGSPADRIRLAQQRPGRLEPLELARSPRVSRDQLRIRALPNGRLEVENVGRCPLLLNGEPTQRAFPARGDVLELKEQQVFLCVERPGWMEEAPADQRPAPFPFGLADPCGLVGESPAVWEVRRLVAFAAARQTHVLIQGESGTGKELVARGIHQASSRRGHPLIARNAATFPETLIDAELFGNARGYPNPGMKERAGLIGDADGSTLFLDEFGELPSELQSHLLRVLDEGEYTRLGESHPRKADLRLVAATNRPLESLKHDVAARLKLRISMPDLNHRREDVPLLARHLLRGIARRDPALAGRFFVGGTAEGEPRLSPALVTALARHQYKTHVRELEALLWKALAGSPRDFLDVTRDMPLRFEAEGPEEEAGPENIDPREITAEQLREALARHDGVQARVWQELGLKNRFVLRRLLKKHGIETEGDEEP